VTLTGVTEKAAPLQVSAVIGVMTAQEGIIVIVRHAKERLPQASATLTCTLQGVETRTVGAVKVVVAELGEPKVPPQVEVHIHEPPELDAESVTV
jgi:hypothetical protein